jgi:uncharacterized protein YndB with AHSA1/START domain
VSDEVRREQFIPAGCEEVWAALTDPRALEGWLAEEAVLELQPGGDARFRLHGGEERSGIVEEVLAPERLAFWWRPAEHLQEPLTRVEFTLTETEGGTLLRVVESRETASLETILSPSFEHRSGGEGPQMSARETVATVA